MGDKDELGRWGEQCAAAYLERSGYAVLDRNWRCSEGELDLVVTRGANLVFVEVKTRRTAAFGHPLEAITARKRSRLRRLALAWTAAHEAETRRLTLRVDAVCVLGSESDQVEVEHLQDIA